MKSAKQISLLCGLLILLSILYFCRGKEAWENNEGIYAKMDTSKGEIVIKLFYQKTPLTVTSFVGLAEGSIKNETKAPGIPYYDNITFHRVVSNFVIQTGDPKGDGNGGPGYTIPIEIDPQLKHDSAGTVGMARSNDPNSNGSQFYITHRATPHLDEGYIVFGKVVKGMAVVHNITQGDKLIKVEIKRIGEKAKKFQSASADLKREISRRQELNRKKVESEKERLIKRGLNLVKTVKSESLTELEPGLKYLILEAGKGAALKENKTYRMHLNEYNLDGHLQKSSYLNLVPVLFRLNSEYVPHSLNINLIQMKKGERRIVVNSRANANSRTAKDAGKKESAGIFEIILYE